MKRRAVGLIFALLVATLAVGIVHADLGDHQPGDDFGLVSANDNSDGITWDGSYFRVLDAGDDKVYTYTSSGTYVSGEDFDLYVLNGDPTGITRDGSFFRILDAGDDKVYTYTSSGTYVSSFSLASANSRSGGIAWDGSYLRVLDAGDDKVYTYTSSGTYVSGENFDLDGNNGDPRHIEWDGMRFRVTDQADDKVYAYTSSGTYVSGEDFDLAPANSSPSGIAWDGTLLRITDFSADKVFAYQGRTFGDSQQYVNAISAAAVIHGDWKCIGSPSGETIQVNNAQLTVHGFCAKPSGASGIDVEIHLSVTTSYADLDRFATVTGFWRFAESASATTTWVYDDSATTETNSADNIGIGESAFTEEQGGLEISNRLGYSTMSKSAQDSDCAEEIDADASDAAVTNGRGFVCDRTNLVNLSAGETAVLQYALSDDNNFEFADTPTAPDSVTVSRDADYTTATIGWTLYDAVSEYEVQRTTAVQVDVADASRIEYGNPVTYKVVGTQAGIDEYEDSSLQAHRTYQYRVRARGADAASWSAWSDYVFSGAKPEVDLPAPGNLELHSETAASVTASWGAPVGDFDNFTLQRQELILVGGSTFFGNVRSLGDDMWLPMDSTMYEDTTILSGQTYEYRVAAVLDDQVGVYTDWFRVGPVNASLGPAPANFRRLEGMEAGQRVFDARYEFWLGWDEVGRADDYEVQVQTFGLTGGKSLKTSIVTDPTFFHTAFSRVGLRVRARSAVDADTCGAADDNRCLTDWTAWADVGFTPITTVEEPPMTDDTMDASTMELRRESGRSVGGHSGADRDNREYRAL